MASRSEVVRAGWWSLLVVFLAGAAAGAIGCSQNSAAESGGTSRGVHQAGPGADSSLGPAARQGTGPFTIVTTCGMVTDIVAQVVGDKARVVGLLGEGVDPHLYKPTRNDVKQLTEADVIFYSGLLLEGRMADLFPKVARSGKPVFAVTEGVDEGDLLEPPEFGGHYDPHVWMDVAAWSKCTAFVSKMLSAYDPSHAADYQANCDRYLSELEKLHAYARETIATIPESQRVLITAHDAFGYFSRAYGIRVRSVQGISTESQAAVSDINQLIDLIVGSRIPAIFVETSVSEKNIQAIVEGASKRNWQVAIGGQLFSDAMGAPGTYEGTYIGMIDHNVTVITRALGGQAPARGLHGKLNL